MAISPVNAKVRDKDKASTIDKINTGLGLASSIYGGYSDISKATTKTPASPAPTPAQGATTTPMPELTQESVSRYNQNKYSLGVDLNLFNYKKARP